MEETVSEILENILSNLSLEGSFEVEEKDEGVFVSIDTEDPGRLIGYHGQTLSSLQLLVNLILSRKAENPKRVIIDVGKWREEKEGELADKSKVWAKQVIEEKKPLELPPMPSWQRRIIHLSLEKIEGVKSESTGEGIDRHLVIEPVD